MLTLLCGFLLGGYVMGAVVSCVVSTFLVVLGGKAGDLWAVIPWTLLWPIIWTILLWRFIKRAARWQQVERKF